MTKKIVNHNRLYIKLVSFFLLLTVAAIFLVLHFALSKVTIKIFSQVEDKTSTINIPLQIEGATTTSADSILSKILSTELELSASIPSLATSTPADRASGFVTIYNKYSKDQTLVKTTRLLSTDNKIYRINEKVMVPAGASVKVWAQADAVGTDYVSSGGHLTIPGLWAGLQDKIYAESTDGFKLESIPSYSVTADNIAEAKKQILEKAQTDGLKVINSLVPANLQIDQQRLFLKIDTVDSSYIGQNVPTATVKQKITVYGLVFSVADLQKMAEDKFNQSLDNNQNLIEFVPAGFSYQITDLDLEKNEGNVEVTIEAKLNTNSKTWSIDKDRVAGQNEAGIKKYLQDELNIDKVEVKFFPFWVHTAPKLKDHIIIE